MVGRYEDIPFVRDRAAPAIEGYTVGKALEGLFYMLGKQEEQIRKDPTARVTDLLKEVFAKDK